MGNIEQFNDSIKSEINDIPSDHLITSSRNWLEAGDVMSKDIITISPDQCVFSAAKIMSDNHISCIIVTDNENVAGIITETDILKRVAANENNFVKIRVAEIMSSPVECIPRNLSVLKASRIMIKKHIKRLPILEGKKLVGIVTQTDLARTLTSYGMWKNAVDIMSRDVERVQTSNTVAEAVEVMASHNVSCVLVLEGNEPKGIFTERDLLRKVVSLQKEPARLKMEKVMSCPVISIPPDCSAFEASKIMEKMKIRRLIVMEDKQLYGILTQTDIFITVKKKLKEQEEQNFSMLQQSESNIYTLDLDGKITYVNPAFMKLLEVSDPGELIGKTFLPEQFWFDQKDRSQFLEEQKKDSIKAKELTLKTSKGRRIYVTLFSTSTKNVHGETNGSQGILYDITEKKELATLRKTEQALRESKNRLSEQNARLEQMVQQRTAEIIGIRDVTVFALAKLAESRDPETGEHLERLRAYSQILAEILREEGPYTNEIDEQFLEDLFRSSPLHDIGKIGIPDTILLKPGRLSVGEFEIMKRHTVIGAETLGCSATQNKSGSFLIMAAEVARSHHERFDGSGYPSGLSGQHISLAARIVALADVYDAITSSRVYKSAFEPRVAKNMVEKEKGKHFDPAVVDAFRAGWEDFVNVQGLIDNHKPELVKSAASNDARR
jgi:PAS domain S-box-containing protein